MNSNSDGFVTSESNEDADSSSSFEPLIKSSPEPPKTRPRLKKIKAEGGQRTGTSQSRSPARAKKNAVSREKGAKTSGSRYKAVKEEDGKTEVKTENSGGEKSVKKTKNAKSEGVVIKTEKNDEECPVFSADQYQVNWNIEPLEADENCVKWWEGNELQNDVKWKTLRHNGVLFPPPYTPHGVKIKYKDAELTLTPEQEEAATWFAALLESEHAKNPIFRRNFFASWKKLLGKNSVVKDLESVDFGAIFDFLQTEKERKALLRKDPEFKQAAKEEKETLLDTYGFVLVDGIKQRVGNYMVEIPGLFRGRGKHPKAGVIKRRIMPEDIILNIGRGEKIPRCPVEGHQWGGIIHNDKVTYIARWKDPINETIKCVFLHASSMFKGQSDKNKFEVARALKEKIDYVRERYTHELTNENATLRQRATAVWFIDCLAIRVGNEKDTSKAADTVGVCTLRLEHIRLLPENFLKLDFLGKDSIRYLNTVKIEKTVYKNLSEFSKKKKKSDLIFDLLNTRMVNQYLSELCEGLTAKVFRTYNASFTLQKELSKETVVNKDNIDKKKYFYDEANRQVAILCNHQKAVSKTFDQTMQKNEQKLGEMKSQLKQLKKDLKSLKKGDEKGKATGKRSKSAESLEKSIKRLKARIEKQSLNIKLKSSTKEIALGTSKINYMDPRITVAWCKRKEMPIEKIFQKALLDKFPWALNAPPDFEF